MERILYMALYATSIVRVVWGGDSEITLFLKHIHVLPDCAAVDAVDFLNVTYESGAFANKGKELTPTEVKNQPIIDWNSKDSFFYTLMMIHSETTPECIKTLTKECQFHHWLVVNISGNDVSSGDIISEYLSSGPSKGTGLHLYVFLLYKQPRELEFEEKFINRYSMAGRSNFSVGDFSEKYNLGLPLASNYYVAQYDDYVPIVHAQIGY
ncbi:protein D3-like [Eupeodes corollae]|uniref:protein D3-like n=1 Tax=Eupeodes corollae TaxID=290404 RepID=UPI0024903186|nr:protein D3-like [Eupeodes corollae]